MAFRAESTVKSFFARPIEAWVWPLTAAIVLGGSILFWSFAGLFWLATHPSQKTVVIWTTSTEMHTERLEDAIAPPATIAEENRHDAQAN